MSRLPLFLTFFAVALGVFALMQWRLYRGYRAWVEKSADPGKRESWLRAAKWTLVGGNAASLSRFVFSELGSYDLWPVQAFVIYPGGVFFGAVLLGFLVFSVRDVLSLLSYLGRGIIRIFVRFQGGAVRPVPIQPPIDDSRRRFMKTGGLAAIATIGGLPAFASASTARDYQINRIPLFFEDLPSSLEGFTIAQISDLHSGIFMTESQMREIFEMANELHPNLMLLTGDQVDNSDAQIEPMRRATEMLKADYGVFSCLGNHDHYATASRVTAALETNGISVLNNAHVVLKVDGDHLSVIGVDDAGSGRRSFADLDGAMNGLPPGVFKVLLTHRPDMFRQAKTAGVQLSLAGHTHGGQVGIEFGGINLNPIYLVHEYAKGLYHEEDKYLYVNVGVGMVGVPIRLVKPEIALFSLHAGTQSSDVQGSSA